MGKKRTAAQIDAVNKERDKKIYKADTLLQKARFTLSLTEQRFILYGISKIKPTDELFEKYTFQISDFQKICGIYDDESYTKLKRILGELKRKCWWIVIDDPDEKGQKCESLVSWFEVIRINKNTGKITVKFNEDMMPYLLKLARQREEGKGFYTQYTFRYVLPMRSQYSIRLYELLKSYQKNNREWWFELNKLKHLLDCDSYKTFKDFRVRVLEPALKEINKFTDLKISYETEKDGKRVEVINFIMNEKDIDERLEAQRAGLTELDGKIHWWDSEVLPGQINFLDIEELSDENN